MPVLAINSHVAHGYVGNGAAVFALRRLGVEVWPLYTVALSNHPGYATCRGRATSTACMRPCTGTPSRPTQPARPCA